MLGGPIFCTLWGALPENKNKDLYLKKGSRNQNNSNRSAFKGNLSMFCKNVVNFVFKKNPHTVRKM